MFHFGTTADVPVTIQFPTSPVVLAGEGTVNLLLVNRTLWWHQRLLPGPRRLRLWPTAIRPDDRADTRAGYDFAISKWGRRADTASEEVAAISTLGQRL